MSKSVKVVLIHPNHENCTDPRLDPPMGLLYIAAHLENNDIDVEICDLSDVSLDGLWGVTNDDSIRKSSIIKADIYGITAYISSLDITKDIIKHCRYVNPIAKIVVGGAHASVRPEDFPEANHVVRGQGEEAKACRSRRADRSG